jgi:hypothetical protein
MKQTRRPAANSLKGNLLARCHDRHRSEYIKDLIILRRPDRFHKPKAELTTPVKEALLFGIPSRLRGVPAAAGVVLFVHELTFGNVTLFHGESLRVPNLEWRPSQMPDDHIIASH